MSHFSVAVFHHPNQDIDDLLAPYDENAQYDNEEDETHYNPDAKWDWYTIGGRWDGLLRTKSGDRVNEALIKNIDFEPDPDHIAKAKRWWAVCIDKELPQTNVEADWYMLWKEEYYRERFSDADDFALKTSLIITHAVIMPDGKWYEEGSMGWFGMSSASIEEERRWADEYSKFFDNVDEGDIVTIVDCHI